MTITVYILSVIPKLAETVAKRLPRLNIKNVVKSDVRKGQKKIVTEEELSQLQDAKIILGDGDLLSQIYGSLKSTQWVHCTWGGVEKMAKSIQHGPKPTFVMTRMGSQKFSQLMAEYTIGWILNMERGWLDARQYQFQGVWAHKDKIATYRSLREVTVGVLGVGLIGSEVIRSLKFFSCRVLGLGRSAVPNENLLVDKYFELSNLPLFLEECDYIVNTLPSTPETEGFLQGDTLQAAKKQPIFINIGRGNIINENDIFNALDQAWISAAILDVFEQEPLPETSPLWTHKNIIITPHVAGVSGAEDVVEAFSENLDRFLTGELLLNVADWGKGY